MKKKKSISPVAVSSELYYFIGAARSLAEFAVEGMLENKAGKIRFVNELSKISDQINELGEIILDIQKPEDK